MSTNTATVAVFSVLSTHNSLAVEPMVWLGIVQFDASYANFRRPRIFKHLRKEQRYRGKKNIFNHTPCVVIDRFFCIFVVIITMVWTDLRLMKEPHLVFESIQEAYNYFIFSRVGFMNLTCSYCYVCSVSEVHYIGFLRNFAWYTRLSHHWIIKVTVSRDITL